MSTDKIKLMIVDDHALVQEGLVSMLSLKENIDILATAENGLEALEKLKQIKPDIILMDIRMPKLHGIKTSNIIAEQYPEIHILFLSMHDSPHYVVNAIKSGAKGYILKTSPLEEVVEAIEQVAAGKTYFSEKVAKIYMEALRKHQSHHQSLTEREEEILILTALGKTSKEIGEQLAISSRTVEVHRSNIKNKLGISTAAGLVKFALDEGLLENHQD